MRHSIGRAASTGRARTAYQTPDQLRAQAKDLLAKANEAQAQWELARRQHDEAARLVLALGAQMRSLRAQAADAAMAASAAADYGRGPNFGRGRYER